MANDRPAVSRQRLGRHGRRRAQHQDHVIGAVEPFQRVVHEHPGRAVVEVQQPRQAREVVIEVDAVDQRGPARPGRARDVPGAAREVEDGAALEVDRRRAPATAGASSRPSRSTPTRSASSSTSCSTSGRIEGTSGAPPRRRATAPPARARSSRSPRACRLRAPPPGAAPSTVQGADVHPGQEPAVGGAAADRDVRPRSPASARAPARRGRACRRPGSPLRARAPASPRAHPRTTKVGAPTGPPAAGCEMPAVTSAAAVRLDANLLEAQARSRNQRTCAPGRLRWLLVAAASGDVHRDQRRRRRRGGARA